MNKKQIIIVGAGGHAKVVANALLCAGEKVLGFIEREKSRLGGTILGIEILGGDDFVLQRDAKSIVLVNGIGQVEARGLRCQVFERFKKAGFEFMTVVHPSAIIAHEVILMPGAQVMAGAVIQPGSSVGENSIINTRSSIDHDCKIGAHAHIAPGAVLSGNVTVGEGAFIGTGASIIHGINIGSNSVIGAGSVVYRHVESASKIVGFDRKLVAALGQEK